MSLILRFLKVLLAAVFGRRLDLLDGSVLAFRVWPNDLDVNFHMNNGRYLTVMDLGRVDLMLRARLAGAILRRRWMPVVAAINIRYRRSLAPFQRYRLRTRLVSWDEKWLYLEQSFETQNGVAATAMIKAALRGRQGAVPTAEILKEFGLEIPAPPIPEDFSAWIACERIVAESRSRNREAA